MLWPPASGEQAFNRFVRADLTEQRPLRKLAMQFGKRIPVRELLKRRYSCGVVVKCGSSAACRSSAPKSAELWTIT